MADVHDNCDGGIGEEKNRSISSSSSGKSSDSSGWGSDDAMDDDSLLGLCVDNEVKCLFCSDLFRSIEMALSHCSKIHEFDLYSLKNDFDMDCYSFIKLINFIRIHSESGHNILDTFKNDIMKNKKILWEDDKYLKPVLVNDPWLSFDFEGMDEMDCGNHISPVVGQISGSEPHVSSVGHHVNLENGRVTLSEIHFNELQKDLHKLRAEVHNKELMLEEYGKQVLRMQETLKNVVAPSSKDNKVNNALPEETSSRCVRSVDVDDDYHYFNSYSHFSIHHEMLSDKVRTETYREAINLCAAGKKVMDLGCGTGILSMFAASAGAEKVVAVDQSDIYYHAMDIVRENGLDKKIQLVKGRLEDITLEDDKFDIIVSEWMGYFLLFEGMLDSVIYARDKHLKEGGIMLPNRCSISLTGFSNKARHKDLIGFWSDVYGYKMNCMKKEVVREALVEIVDNEESITNCCEVFSIDVMKATVETVNFVSEFELCANRDGELTSVVGHFDVFFDLVKCVHFSTGPSSIPTHWKQTIFFLKQPISVKKGDVLPGKIICQRHLKEVRSLCITLIIKEHKQVFILN